MGQTNQSPNQQRDPYSSCCFSRRYILHTNMQKENKLRPKNHNPAPSQNHELHIYSKQRPLQNIDPKPHSNPLISSVAQFKPHQQNLKLQKLKFQEIEYLQLESHLVEKIENNDKLQDLNNEKKEILQLPDVSEENERNSTRENSLSSKNFSKNSISSNNHKLRNKIKNLKFKYTTNQDPQSKLAPSLQYLPKISSQKDTNFIKNQENNKLKMKSTPNKVIPQTLDTFPEHMERHSPIEEIEFFSQDSDSNSSSSNSRNNGENYEVNEEMLSSQKIDLMVGQFKRDLKAKNKVMNYPCLERIPEESQRIHSSKSEDQLPHSNKNKFNRNTLPHKISQESFTDKIKKDFMNSQGNKVQNNHKKISKMNNRERNEMKSKGNEDVFKKQSTPESIEKRKTIEGKNDKVCGSERVLQKEIANKPPRSSKKIIAF